MGNDGHDRPDTTPDALGDSCALGRPPQVPGDRIDFTEFTGQTRPASPSDLKRVFGVPVDELLKRRVVANAGGQGVADSAVDYLIEGTVESGGMGEVLLARQVAFDRFVALKRLQATRQAPNGQLAGEAVVAGKLQHPNIVPIYDLALDAEGRVFFAMKLVEGQPWSDCIDQLDLADNLRIFDDVCQAIAYAHDQGVAHLDLKPRNVMVGSFGETIVVDWGLAATLKPDGHADISLSTASGGTAAYASPEVARGDSGSIGRASDIYLLGALLFRILTGKPPHGGASPDARWSAAKANLLQAHDADSVLMQLALKALSTDPSDRFPSVAVLQAAIRDYERHADSHRLTERAQQDLLRGRQTGVDDWFSQCVFACDEAERAWPQNTAAPRLRREARLAHAEARAEKHDFAKALELLDPSDPTHRKAYTRIHRKHRRRENLQELFKLSLAALALALVGIGAVTVMGYTRVKREQRQTQNAFDLYRLDQQLVPVGSATPVDLVANWQRLRAAKSGARDPDVKRELDERLDEIQRLLAEFLNTGIRHHDIDLVLAVGRADRDAELLRLLVSAGALDGDVLVETTRRQLTWPPVVGHGQRQDDAAALLARLQADDRAGAAVAAGWEHWRRRQHPVYTLSDDATVADWSASPWQPSYGEADFDFLSVSASPPLLTLRSEPAHGPDIRRMLAIPPGTRSVRLTTRVAFDVVDFTEPSLMIGLQGSAPWSRAALLVVDRHFALAQGVLDADLIVTDQRVEPGTTYAVELRYHPGLEVYDLLVDQRYLAEAVPFRAPPTAGLALRLHAAQGAAMCISDLVVSASSEIAAVADPGLPLLTLRRELPLEFQGRVDETTNRFLLFDSDGDRRPDLLTTPGAGPVDFVTNQLEFSPFRCHGRREFSVDPEARVAVEGVYRGQLFFTQNRGDAFDAAMRVGLALPRASGAVDITWETDVSPRGATRIVDLGAASGPERFGLYAFYPSRTLRIFERRDPGFRQTASWRDPASDFYAAEALDVDGDGQPEIVASVGAPTASPRLFGVRPGQVIEPFDTPAAESVCTLNFLTVTRFDEDEPHVVVAAMKKSMTQPDSDAGLRVYRLETDGRLAWRATVPGEHFGVVAGRVAGRPIVAACAYEPIAGDASHVDLRLRLYGWDGLRLQALWDTLVPSQLRCPNDGQLTRPQLALADVDGDGSDELFAALSQTSGILVFSARDFADQPDALSDIPRNQPQIEAYNGND